MSKIETNFSIGDLVYTANARGIDRDVIKGIKVIGLKEEVLYGFKTKSDYYWLFTGSDDGFTWYKSSEIFESKEQADRTHKLLAKKQKARDDAKKHSELVERRAELEKELADLEARKLDEEDE